MTKKKYTNWLVMFKNDPDVVFWVSAFDYESAVKAFVDLLDGPSGLEEGLTELIVVPADKLKCFNVTNTIKTINKLDIKPVKED